MKVYADPPTDQPRTDREVAQAILQDLPENATMDDILYEFYLQAKIADGLRDVEAGRTIPHEEVMRIVASWSKSNMGQARVADR